MLQRKFEKMKLFRSGGKKKQKPIKDNSYLSIDIGTEFVKIVLFSIVDGAVHVWGYDRVRQKETSMHNALIINLEKVIDTVDVAIGSVIQKADLTFGQKFHPTKAILGIAGELVKGVSILVDVEREDADHEITRKEVEHILMNVSEHTFTSTIEDISQEIGLEPKNIQEIDIAIDSVSIDGIKVSNPIGLKGSELTYRVYSTFAPKVHYNSVKSVAERLGLTLERIVVQPYALATSIKGLSDPSNSCIIIDVGGGTTDVALVRGGDVIGTKMFSIGGRTFTKRIQKELALEYYEAEQKKIEYSLNKLPAAEENEIRDGILKDVEVWVNTLLVALEEFDEVSEYPPMFYLCGGGTLLPEIKSALLEYPWSQHLNFKKHPRVEFVFPNKVKDLVDESKSATEPTDVTPLALARSILD